MDSIGRMKLNSNSSLTSEWGEETQSCLRDINLLLAAYGDTAKEVGIPGIKEMYSSLSSVIAEINRGGPQALKKAIDRACDRSSTVYQAVNQTSSAVTNRGANTSAKKLIRKYSLSSQGIQVTDYPARPLSIAEIESILGSHPTFCSFNGFDLVYDSGGLFKYSSKPIIRSNGIEIYGPIFVGYLVSDHLHPMSLELFKSFDKLIGLD